MISSLYQTARNAKSPLRVGVFLNSAWVPRCVERILRDIVECDFATLELIVFKSEPVSTNGTHANPLWRKISKRVLDQKARKSYFYDLYTKLDKSRTRADDPLGLVDCSELIHSVKKISVQPIVKGFTNRFPPEAIAEMKESQLDVVLRFGFNILRGDVLQVARYGVWSYHHGDNDYYRGGPAHLWELREKNPLSGVILQVLTEELDGGQVLCKGLFNTHDGLFVSRNRYQPYWETTHYVIWKLHELYKYGWEHVQAKGVPTAPYQGKRKLYKTPTNSEMATWLAPRVFGKILKRTVSSKVVPHWKTAIRSRKTHLLDGSGFDMAGFQWLESPKGRFWADPFLFRMADKYFIFFEDYSYSQKRAVISCAEVSSTGVVGEVRPCLETGAHLSYPFVFEHEGDVFMIPESAEKRNVTLYRAKKFPYEWVEHAVLFDKCIALDTTAWFEDKTWWFFTTLSDKTLMTTPKLMLFYANSLTNSWELHPACPISFDIRTSRGAGALFRHNGRLIRPSQSGSPNYGHSFGFNEITELSKTHYSEKSVGMVGPSWHRDLIGTHTYNRCGDLEVTDGCLWSPTRLHYSES
jgi:hypothetical protein